MTEFNRQSCKLKCSPLAYLKWQFLAHAGPSEAAGLGLSAHHDPLYLQDILVIDQKATVSTVAFEDEAIADLFEKMTDQNIPPHRFGRIWLHSHPGGSARPSSVDEVTFRRVFGACDWAVMAIMSRTANTYARIQFGVGPGGSWEIPVVVDWQAWPSVSSLDSHLVQWRQEYEQHVKQVTFDFWEGLEEDPNEVLSDSVQPDLLSWGQLYANSQSGFGQAQSATT